MSDRRTIQALLQRTRPDPLGWPYGRDPEGAPPVGPTEHAIGAHFAVLVWQDGGTTDGDKTTQCDRTYRVRTLDASDPDTGGVLLGTGMTPTQKRPTTGTLVTPPTTGAGVVGVGYYDADGDFQLWSANEALDTDACT